VARALALPEDTGVEKLVSLIRAGGPQRAVQLQEVAHFLGVGLANVVNLLNPRLVILGGLLRDLYPLVSEQVGFALAASALRAPMEQVTLAVPELGGDAVLIGAAEFAWEATLADPAAVLG
jgi:predicted NBD/HSP70 family sugar kinase